ncbi:MAG TPA: SIS domain-containing protein [Candidatus Limnocylindrales bacterium]
MADTATLPLRPLPTVRRSGIDRALAARTEIEALARKVVDDGLRNVYMTGSGGGLITFGHLQFELEQGTARFPSFAISANELIYRSPAALGKGSIVLLASNTGTTPEVVAAANWAKERGAFVISTTKKPDSPLAQASDVAWTYGDDKGIGDPKQFYLALFGLALLRETGDIDAGTYDGRVAALEALPDALIAAVRGTEPLTAGIAADLKDEEVIYVLGSGPNHSTAYCLAMCYLQEMQWKHAASFDAAEFLHGAMEVVTDDVPVILFLGEESTRAIDERAKRFLDSWTAKRHYVDARDLDLPGIAAEQRPFVSNFALNAVMSRIAEQFEAATGHDLQIRRYMFRVEY